MSSKMTDVNQLTMLEKLTAIRDIGEDIDPENISDSIEASRSRSEAFEEVLLRDYPILGYCGCGTPALTLQRIHEALVFCTISTEYDDTERTEYLQEVFGTDYVSHDGLVQFLFYILVTLELVNHSYSLNAATLTEEGEIFQQLLTDFLSSDSNMLR